MSQNTTMSEPPVWIALVPVLVLITLLGSSVYLFGDDATYGPNQIALLFAAGISQLIGHRQGWSALHAAMIEGISLAMGACLILLMVGVLIGTWMLSGTAPALIYYGLGLLAPDYFYPAACIICALIAMTVGSSWSCVGTVGVALIGIAQVLELSPAIAAGAIVSGAYFGDKLSPLSDTTNLAPGLVGVDLFDHIRYLLWTTIPAMLAALGLYTLLTFMDGNVRVSNDSVNSTRNALSTMFDVGLVSLLPLALLIVMAIRRIPAYPTLAISSISAIVVAVVIQTDTVITFGSAGQEISSTEALVRGVWTVMTNGFEIDSGDPVIDTLLSRGGMASMLNTVWLIICAMVFGAAMERTGQLQSLATALLGRVHSTGSLIGATLATGIGMNILASDQYMAIVLPGRMYRLEFAKRGLHPVTLSRTLEDAGTMTSPLVPWNSCGAFMAATLAVPTLTYFSYAFVNLLSPVIAMIYAAFDIRIRRISAS